MRGPARPRNPPLPGRTEGMTEPSFPASHETPVVLSWSGGKDCSLALGALRADPSVRVAGLMTTVTAGYERISMHGVPRLLLERQARLTGLPLQVVEIEPRASNRSYEEAMRTALDDVRGRGIHSVAFGDLFLEDVRRYREEMTTTHGLTALFPLWRRETSRLALEFIRTGFRAIITCVDTHQLDGSFAGRWFDESFLADLPSGVDPCGENGEFHTFVIAGPILAGTVELTRGELVLRDERFLFCDLLPG